MERARGQWTGIALVALGALLLLGRVIDANVALGAFAWPLFILAPGALMLAAGLGGSRASAGLTVPGSVVAAVGLILLWQSVTGRFETWAYLWTLLPTATGLGLYLQGVASDDEELRHGGRRTAAGGLTALLVIGAFFELLIFGGLANGFTGRVVIPVLLIGSGAYLLTRRHAGSDLARPERGRER